MKKLFLLLALLGMVAVGCSKDDTDKGNDNKTEQPNDNEGNNEETPVFEVDSDGNYNVEAEGGEVLLAVTTNLEYSVYIPKDARSWIFYEGTRAVRNETVVLSVEPNSDTELRTATVELRDAEGETLEHFTIVQKPYSIIEDDEPEEEDPIFESDNEGNYSITAEGGEIVVTVATNIEYSVDIPKEAQSWISLADTRAVHLEKIVFSVAENATMAERSAVIKLLGADNEVLQDFTITQGAERNITCNNNEIIYTTKYGYAIDLAITDGFGGNYVSHTFEGGYGKIIFDNDVVTIPLNAFRDCSSITNIYLPSCVQEIGKGAFYGCESLASITLPDSLTKIGEWAFAGCALEYVAIDTLSHWCNITFVDDQANPLFYSNDLLVGGEVITTLTIPDDITTINPYAFRGWKNLTNITIPDNVTTIGNYAFSGCTSELIINSKIIETDYSFDNRPTNGGWLNGAKFTKLTIGDGIEKIGDYVFYDCDSLTSITIPDSVTTIGKLAFYNCSSLQEFNGKFASDDGRCLIIDGTLDSFAPAGLTEYTIPNSVTAIGDWVFGYCSSLTSVTIPDSVTTIGESAFNGCTGELIINSKIVETDYTYNNYPSYYGWLSGAKFTKLTIGDSVTTIGDWTFGNCDNLTSVTIPNSVTTIGESAFRGCSSLTSVTIPDSVTTIGEDAFGYCKSLTSVTIGDSVTTIGNYAFEDCSSLTSVTIPDSVTTIGVWAFYDCSSLTSVTIPDSVTTIGERAFRGCTGELIVNCNIPSASSSSYGAFYGSKFTSVTIGDSVTTIGNYAFYNCCSLTSVTIGDSVTTIGSSAFEDCSSLTSVYISDIAAWCNISFSNVYSNPLCWKCDLYLKDQLVTDLTIPEGVTSIKYEAFCYCSSLINVTIPNSVTKIGSYAFQYCANLTSVTIGDSVTSIGERAFRDCSSLTSVTIGNSVTTIGDVAFYNCSSLTHVTIGNSVTTIGSSAFRDCSSLTSVIIPDSVTTIGSNAFSGCTGELIVNCNIPSASSSSYGAFYGSKFTSVTIGDSVTSIGSWAFEGCSSLTSITIPDSVTSIGGGAFFGCSSLTSISIPDSVTTIGDYAFAYCYSLTSVTIPDSVTTIGSYAFSGCSSLTSVTIPDSVTTIGKYAFYKCSSLTSVYCKATTPPAVTLDYYYDWCAFDGNASGRKIYVPMESVEAYKSASYWSEYSYYIKGYNF